MKIRPDQIKKIKIAQKALNLEDEAYRGLLHNEFKRSSCTNLTSVQADKLLAEFRRLGYRPKGALPPSSKAGKARFENLGHRPGMASPAQLRKIEVVWVNISYAENKTKALRRFLFRMFRVDSLEFLTFRQAHVCIESLKKMGAS